MKKLCKKIMPLLIAGILLCMFGCNNASNSGPEETKFSNAEPTSPISNLSKPDTSPSEIVSTETPEEKEDFLTSSPENDTDIGLKNIKIDTAEHELTEQQRSVLAYFDDDYLSVPSYEFLRRYPTVFEGAQLTIWGTVKKVISMDSNSYEVILWLNVGPVEYEYSYDYPEYEGNYIYLTGKTGTTWFMEGDTLQIYGRYIGVQSLEVDNTAYTIPHINVFQAFYDTSDAPNDIYRYIPKFSLEYIKEVASVIFSENIEVRLPIVGTDVTEDIYMMQQSISEENPLYYVVELENQTNAKFTKYFFATGTNSDVINGRITDAKDALNPSGIERHIEFAADFSHFFLFTYDTNLESLTLEYYDNALNKIWKREFPETTNALYDYTKSNIYLAANNELYIINIETGTDTYAPSYVGEKVALRKLHDGILLVSSHKSDGLMKVGLDGKIIWKTNLADDTHAVNGIQIVNNTLIFDQYYWNSYDDYGTHYIVLDSTNGSVILDAVSMS